MGRTNKAVLFLLVAMCTVHSSHALECEDGSGINQSYIFSVGEFVSVARFVIQMPPVYFKGMQYFSGESGRRVREQIFYDDDELNLLESSQGLSHIIKSNLQDYRQDKEVAVYSDGTISPSSEKLFSLTRYNKKLSSLDKHPLFQRVKRKERAELLERIKSNGVQRAVELIPSLRIEHDELVYLITRYGQTFVEVKLDKFQLDNFGLGRSHLVLSIDADQGQYGSLTDDERIEISSRICRLHEDIQGLFTNAEQRSEIGYQFFSQIADQENPARRVFIKYPIIFKMGQVGLLSLIGFLLLYLLLGHYRKESFIKVKKRSSKDFS